jgi:hypothetical protein
MLMLCFRGKIRRKASRRRVRIRKRRRGGRKGKVRVLFLGDKRVTECVCCVLAIGAILSFSRAFWLTVFGFMYSSRVLDSCVKVRCLVLCIGKFIGRRCRSVIDIAVSF